MVSFVNFTLNGDVLTAQPKGGRLINISSLHARFDGVRRASDFLFFSTVHFSFLPRRALRERQVLMLFLATFACFAVQICRLYGSKFYFKNFGW
jgi:hypothetical protein